MSTSAHILMEWLSAEWGHAAHLDTMLRFHLGPTLEAFNEILELDCETRVVVHKYIGDVALEGGDYNDMAEYAENALGISHESKPKFTDALILAWVGAAITVFPWLIIDCRYPLIVDRAISYRRGSLRNIMDEFARSWSPRRHVASIAIMQYGASGDRAYITDVFGATPRDVCCLNTVEHTNCSECWTFIMQTLRDYYAE